LTPPRGGAGARIPVVEEAGTPVNRTRLFLASCLALVTIAMPFAIRADILSALGTEFNLSHEGQGMLGLVAGWAYPVAILIGGSLCDRIGLGRLLGFASIGHITGLLITIVSPLFGVPALILGTLVIGLADGSAESVINPLITTLYPKNRTGRLSMLHASWPVGLIIGGLVCVFFSWLFGLDVPGVADSVVSLSWKAKMSTALLAAVGYGLFIRGQKVPPTERVASGHPAAGMFRECLRPGIILLALCMAFTAITEVGPDLWMGSVLTDLTGVRGIVFLIYTAVIMLVLRVYGGPLVRMFGAWVVLTVSSFLAGAGLWQMSMASAPLAALAGATLFGIGKTLLWPTLLGVASEKYPKGGSFMLAMLSAVGMITGGLASPVMGRIYDSYIIERLPAHVARVVVVDGRYSPAARAAISSPADIGVIKEAERYGASMAYRFASFTPLVPFLIYVVLWFRARRRQPRRTG
jgi:MFS family permease